MTSAEGPRPQNDDEQAVPAAGGTFGVTDDRSEYGQPLIGSAGSGAEDAADDDSLDVDGLTDEAVGYGEVRSPEYGEQLLGYGATGQGYDAMPAHSESYGAQPSHQFAPTQFGNEPAAAKAPMTFSLIGLALAIVGLVLLCLPGWTWMIGGALGIPSLALGVIGLSREPQRAKPFAWLALVGGGIAIAIGVATAIVVFS